jgi:hypothetical protein
MISRSVDVHISMFISLRGVMWLVSFLVSMIFSMLSTPEASLAVFEGETGTLAGVSDGKMIIDCATLAESDMKRMSEKVSSKGG